MSRRRAVIIWVLYSLCAVFFLLLQNWLFKRIVIWGIHPVILPFLAVLPAITQKWKQSVVYAFLLGLFFDITAPVFLPCFYCIILPVLAFFANLISQRIIMSYFVCATITCGASLLCIDFCHTLFVLYTGKALLLDALLLCGREFLLSMMVFPVLLFAYSNLRRFIATS